MSIHSIYVISLYLFRYNSVSTWNQQRASSINKLTKSFKSAEHNENEKRIELGGAIC